MFKSILEFIECMCTPVSEEEVTRRAEQRWPGAAERLASLKASEEARRKRMASSKAGVPTYAKFQGSMTDVSDPAVMAHLRAASGSLDPKVAFSLGAPGAPDGTGKLVGWNGHYRG